MTDLEQAAKRHLDDLVSFFGVNTEATVTTDEEGIKLDIVASEITPRLIGHRGETLRALEYLVNQMLKRTDGLSPRVSVDIAGYKQQRREQLEELAREVAARVTESGEEEELRPMNPAERRIVHMTLRDIDTVDTESRGEDRDRRIVVLPKG